MSADLARAPQAWIDAFNAGDLDAIVALYAPDAVLWGTLAPTLLVGTAGIRGYFARVFAPRPAATMALGASVARTWGDTGVVTGSYTAGLPAQGRLVTLPARFSFTYRRAAGAWRIVDHHSSAVPTPPA